MAGRPPKTDKWIARENRHGKKGGHRLVVGGLVQVTNTNKDPHLKEAVPQGINPKILILDLTIAQAGHPGLDVLVWKPAAYSKKVSAGQYDSVDIHWDGKSIATCKVVDDSEHHAHLAAITQAANQTAAYSGKKPAPAKKGAAKKVPAKKAPAKKAPAKKGAAKKGAKKRAAKKSATKKSAAKKSAAKKGAAKKTAKKSAARKAAKKRPAARKK